MASTLVFFYFGDDEAYFRALQGEFQRHTRLVFEFKRIYESDESLIQTLFMNVYREQPAAVFIDFSKQPQDYLHLARLITRIPLDHKMATIGLVDYLSPPEIISESIATGVNLTHIKSTETFDVVYDVAKLIAPAELEAHGFATATLKEDWDAGIISKVGYIHAGGMHIESNYNVSKGDRLKIKHHWQQNKLVPSKEFFVRNTSTKNLFYHFNASLDLDFMFIDEFLPPEGMEPERIKDKKAERDDLVKHHKKQLKKWIDDNLSRSMEKQGKVLVVDRQLLFYDCQPRSDKHLYIIRSIPFLHDISEEMDRLQPQVIAFALEKKDTENAKNNHQSLVKLSEAIKAKYQELNPFIVVFNSPITSQEMQDVLGYPNVMATATELSADVVIKMANVYQKKKLNVKPTVMKKPEEEKIYLRKTNPASICEIMVSVKVLKLSETDMIFSTDYPLPIGSNLHMSQPVDMYVCVQPAKAQGKTPEFLGLIHCLGEVQKKELRRYVNSVFFREHDATLRGQADEFKKLNDVKLQEKVALATKKIEEAQEKKEKEEAEIEKRNKKLAAVAAAAAAAAGNKP